MNRYAPLATAGDLTALIAEVSARLQVEILVRPSHLGPGLCGILLVTDKAAHIGWDQGAPAWKQPHIILHELAHMILKHPLITDAATLLAAQAAGRCPYPAALNAEADAFAHGVMHYMGDVPPDDEIVRVAAISS